MNASQLTPFASNPQHLAAVQKLNDINAALARTNARLAEIEVELTSRRPGTPSPLAMAERILADPSFAGQQSQAESLRGEHLRLRGHVEILRRAQAHQAMAVHEVFQAASRVATAAIAPAHQALARRMANKLREIEELQAEERALVRSVEIEGYEVGSQLERVAWPLIGTLATLPEESQLSMRIAALERYAEKPSFVTAADAAADNAKRAHQ